MKNRFIVILIFSSLFSSAQVRDSLLLGAVEVTETVAKPLESSFSQHFDSIQLSEIRSLDLSNLLQGESGVFIKDYGPGQLSTPTFRGGDAEQTIVLFNGAKINSPALGSIDFTLIPTSQFSGIDLFSSASANSMAVGGIGGGVSLKSRINTEKREAELNLGIASFNQKRISILWNQPFFIGKNKGALFYSAQFRDDQNSFNYLDIYDDPFIEKVRVYNEFRMSNHQLNGKFWFSSKTNIQINSWFTSASRNIPKPINLNETFTQKQQDDSKRAQAIIAHQLGRNHLLDLMLFIEATQNEYSDSLAGINNSNEFKNAQSQASWNWRIMGSQNTLINQFFISSTTAESENFLGLQSQSSFGSMHKLSSSLMFSRLKFDLGFRSLGQDNLFQVLPFASADYLLSKKNHLKIISSVSQSARFPTLNELYWQPGGNLNLMPEIGQTAEVGLFKSGKSKRNLIKLIGYVSQIENRIRWLPNGANFSPVNILSSRNLGLDLIVGHCFNLNSDLKLSLKSAISYVNAKGRISIDEPLNRLSFIPDLKSSFSIGIEDKKWSLFSVYQMVSKRFISNDEQAFMPSFSILDVYFDYSIDRIKLSCGVKNLLNTNFQNLPWRPMTGRNLNFGLNMILF